MFEAALSMFAIGTLWFWLLIMFVTFILFYCTEYEYGGWATITVIITLCVLNFLGGIPIFSTFIQNPSLILPSILGYFVVGTGWAFAKWWFYCHDQLCKYMEVKRVFIRVEKLQIGVNDPIPDNFKQKWREYINGYWECRVEVNPRVNGHKMSIYVWIAYFPWSMIWTLINDPVRKICKYIYHNIADTLQRISDRIFDKTKEDF